MFVRGTLLGLVTCLAMTGAPAQAQAPAAALQAEQQAGGTNWQVLKSWKKGTVRACRGKWDGDSFQLNAQLVNRADKGRRGAALRARSNEFPEWDRLDYTPIAAGTRQRILQADIGERPRVVELRAKVTKGEKESSWGKVVRVDRLDIC